MPSEALNRAIQLIQAGQNEQAQVILQGLIRTNQQDLEAWSWYIKSCPTPEKRLQALELCLRFNPGNPQIMDGIQKMREKLAAQQPPPIQFEPAPVSSAFRQVLSPYEFDEIPEAYEKAPPPAPVPVQDSSLEFYAQTIPPPQIDKFVSGTVNVEIDERPGRPLAWYEVWWIALTKPTLDGYATLLRDPLLSSWRACLWTFLTSLVVSLIVLPIGFSNPEVGRQIKTLLNVSESGAFIMVGTIFFSLFGAVFNVLGLMLNAWFYSLLAKVFGGTGTFSRTFYLKAAYNAPLTISSLLGYILFYIPCVGPIAILALSGYTLRLDILSIQAAHRLNGGRATLVVLLPTAVLLLLWCVSFIVFSSMLPTLLRSR